MTLLMNVTYSAFGNITDQWVQILIALSVASMIVGATGAIMQQNIKRMLGYSSIAHMGYALAGLAAGTTEGASAVVIYMTTYVFMGALPFWRDYDHAPRRRGLKNFRSVRAFCRIPCWQLHDDCHVLYGGHASGGFLANGMYFWPL